MSTPCSSICSNLKSLLPYAPNQLASSSTISSSSMPIALSNRPLLFVCLTLVISSCSFDFTMPAGSEVKTSCLFAATRTGTCSGRLEVLPWAFLFCRASRMMPRSALEEVTEETAWCRSLPCPGCRSRNEKWIRHTEVNVDEQGRQQADEQPAHSQRVLESAIIYRVDPQLASSEEVG
ncbi:hypothetical protein KC354_g112 [Hortaea werneckii]|nr:hypothetical protein KC354_g112 [Hortaea werneckii]